MKVKWLSLNIWEGQLIERCADFLAAQDADIVMLQEVNNAEDENLPVELASLKFLQDRLNYPYADYAVTMLINRSGIKVPTGNAILSKFPAVESWHSFLYGSFYPNYLDIPENYPKLPSILQHAVLETSGKQINVFNLHGVWDLDGDNYSDRRQQMAQKTIRAINSIPNVLLGGDTNAKPTNQVIKDIGQHLTSVFGESLKSTFNMRRKDNPGYATAAVDMLFVNPHIKILEKQCPDVDISDHLPLVATLEIN